MLSLPLFFFFFFFNDTATTEIYTLSLHDALPISVADGPRLRSLRCTRLSLREGCRVVLLAECVALTIRSCLDRKSTRLNSSHQIISYAVFCLKKKKKKQEGL